MKIIYQIFILISFIFPIQSYALFGEDEEIIRLKEQIKVLDQQLKTSAKKTKHFQEKIDSLEKLIS